MSGIYVHIPYCLRKCQYCDFVSCSDFSTQEAYFAALKQEIACYEKELSSCQFDSLFFGGGTPSAVPHRFIIEALELLKPYLSDGAEITLEANPATLTEEKLSAYSEAGINRLSIGLQSAQECELHLLGRLHTVEDFKKNFRMAREAGFTNINVDIMFGIPEQTVKSFSDTLDTVIAMAPEHLSAYSLILEKGTPLYQQTDLVYPHEAEEREMYRLLKERLLSAGFEQYEISNFAKPGYGCRHNIKYWKMEPFLGFGTAAHSFWNGTRYSNTTDTLAYIEKLNNRQKPVEQVQEETETDLLQDAVITAFRMTEGVDVAALNEQFSIDFASQYQTVLEKYLQSGHLKKTKKGYAFTDSGVEISNYILSDFL